MASQIFPLTYEPGVQRDGTTFASVDLIDAQWMRLVMRSGKALPKKIGGYTTLFDIIPGILQTAYHPGSVFITPWNDGFLFYIGKNDGIFLYSLDANFNVAPPVNVTPTSFGVFPNTIWTFEQMYLTDVETAVVVAHGVPSVTSINTSTEAVIYYQVLGTNDLFQGTSLISSGGFSILSPYLFSFGNNGVIKYLPPNQIVGVPASAAIAPDKIIAIHPTRGGNSSPAGLAWSLTTLVRITHTGSGENEFTFDTISTETSILSSKCIVEYDGRFYWPGLDRFLVYTGVVNTLPNMQNLDYFFNNLDLSQRQKVWGMKLPKYGEIWWFYPNKNLEGYNGECNCALIYNVLLNKWNDTKINRSCGFFDPTFGYPVWMESNWLWQHETGVDKIFFGERSSILSSFKLPYISLSSLGPDGSPSTVDRNIQLIYLEPDFVQNGDLTLKVYQKSYANDKVRILTFTFTPDTFKVDLKIQARFLTVEFISDEIGGDYEMGKPLIKLTVGDERP